MTVGHRGRTTGGLLVALAAVVTAGCQAHDPVRKDATVPEETRSVAAASEEDARTSSELLLDFSDTVPGEPAEVFVNAGTARVKATTVQWGGGRVMPVRGPYNRAVRLPEHRRQDPTFAVIRVVQERNEDGLSPGDLDFAFGVDVAIDAQTTGSKGDDGDNVLQRGLYEGSGQYKIQVDDGLPSCRVRGLTGEVVLIGRGLRLEPGTWYRIRCTRVGPTVTMDVGRIPEDPAERITWSSSSKQGRIGAVVMSHDMPFSVGGKLADEGSILPSSTDQLNGRVDRVFYRVLR